MPRSVRPRPSAHAALSAVVSGTDGRTCVGPGSSRRGAGALEGRTEAYPFFLVALLVWLPATFVLLRAQWRSREAWLAPAGFALSIFLLVFIGRAFHASYLIWPLAGILMAVLLSVAARAPVPSLQAAVPARDFRKSFARGGRRRSFRRGAGARPER